MHLPRFEYFVNDYSQALSQEEFEELNQLAETLETTSGYQVVIEKGMSFLILHSKHLMKTELEIKTGMMDFC